MRVVLTSVRYADFLAVTLPAWKACLPAGVLSVVTSPDDVETQALARAHEVPVLATDAWWQADLAGHVGGQSRFNIAYALDLALGLTPGLRDAPADGEVVANVHPDLYPVGSWPDESVFQPATIHGFWRYWCHTPSDLDAFLRGRDRATFERMKNAKHGPIGYCQAWRHRAGLRFGSYETAAAYDTDFNRHFAHREMRDDVFLLHLGGRDRANWAGRTLPVWGAA